MGFVHQILRVALLVPGFLSEEIVLCVAVDSGCPRDAGELGVLLCHHLEPEPLVALLSLIQSINRSSKRVTSRSPGMSSEGLERIPHSSPPLPHHLVLGLHVIGNQ